MVEHARVTGAAESEASDRVKDALNAYALSGFASTVQRAAPGEPGCAASMRRAAAEYFAGCRTDLLKYWNHIAASVQTDAQRSACIVCGRRTITRRYALEVPYASRRRHTQCPNCGPVEDIAANLRIGLSPHGDGVVRWHGYRPAVEWSAQLVIEPQISAYRMSWPWPAGPAGAPAAEFTTPETWPSLPVRVALLAFWGLGHFAASGFLTRPGRSS
jgi:hypothetical protein